MGTDHPKIFKKALKGSLKGKTAFDLFPDLVEKVEKKDKPVRSIPSPPPPPDTSWLDDGPDNLEGEGPDAPVRALIVFSQESKQSCAADLIRKIGYMAETAASAQEAVAMLQRLKYSLVITGYEDQFATLHEYIRAIDPSKRREMYYALVGPDLHTLYDLEALTLSANLVINDKDLSYLDRILKKGFQDYENLFRPFLEVLNAHPSKF